MSKEGVWVSSVFLTNVLVCFTRARAEPLTYISNEPSKNTYQLLRVYTRNDDQRHLLTKLQEKYKLDPWRTQSRSSASGDFLVRPTHALDFTEELKKRQIDHRLLISDAERFISLNNDGTSRKRSRRFIQSLNFRHRYLNYGELMRFLRHVKSTARGVDVHLGTIGLSFEGRPTPYVKISKGNNSTKKSIFVDGGMHSREWISPAMVVEIIHQLAYNTQHSSAIDELMDKFNWILVPLVNPDGYAYSFQLQIESRLWRKSRSSSYADDPECFGVDLNRNFGYKWNNSPAYGGSSNPCSGTYSGPHSFSEPETRNLRDLLLSNRDTIKGYLTFHSFGQFFLYPWGFSSDVDIKDEKDLLHVASGFADTMREKDYHYSVGSCAKILYPAAGGADDYVRGVVGVKYAYTVELPPHHSSFYGFLVPEEEVKTIVTDTWDGIKAFANRLHKQLSFSLTTDDRTMNLNNKRVDGVASVIANKTVLSTDVYVPV